MVRGIRSPDVPEDTPSLCREAGRLLAEAEERARYLSTRTEAVLVARDALRELVERRCSGDPELIGAGLAYLALAMRGRTRLDEEVAYAAAMALVRSARGNGPARPGGHVSPQDTPALA